VPDHPSPAAEHSPRLSVGIDVSTLESNDHDGAAVRPPNSRRWTDEELATLRRLAWGMTAAQIGVLLGRTALAVRTKAAHERLRLKQEKRSQDGP